ncbi:hypothetical protein ACPOL_6408 [Acidisarcina polymorpha]|uniref:Uncharacterized protein n=1 Tax=Acidisarcina polymorpha TaxID=2211140 RepID=A0A2Z5G9H3_9BACT|nr:hypothetical protein ACPOL_6408 [Acidisarcina polymorpha]
MGDADSRDPAAKGLRNSEAHANLAVIGVEEIHLSGDATIWFCSMSSENPATMCKMR